MVIPLVLAKVAGNLHQSHQSHCCAVLCCAAPRHAAGEARAVHPAGWKFGQTDGPLRSHHPCYCCFMNTQMAQSRPEGRLYLGIRNERWQIGNLLRVFSFSLYRRHLPAVGAPTLLGFYLHTQRAAAEVPARLQVPMSPRALHRRAWSSSNALRCSGTSLCLHALHRNPWKKQNGSAAGGAERWLRMQHMALPHDPARGTKQRGREQGRSSLRAPPIKPVPGISTISAREPTCRSHAGQSVPPHVPFPPFFFPFFFFAYSNPQPLEQIIKIHLYLICLLELIEFLRLANVTRYALPPNGDRRCRCRGCSPEALPPWGHPWGHPRMQTQTWQWGHDVPPQWHQDSRVST